MGQIQGSDAQNGTEAQLRPDFCKRYAASPWYAKIWYWLAGGGPYRRQDRLPPELPGYKLMLLIMTDILFLGAVVFLVVNSVSIVLGMYGELPKPAMLYTALAALVVGTVGDRLLRHRRRVHEERLEDRSEIETRIIEAQNVESRTTHIDRPVRYDENLTRIKKEAKRLLFKGPQSWTEYQVLPLSQFLVAFMPVDELIAGARSMLSEIEDYAVDTKYQYETRHFHRLENTINSAIEKIQREKDTTEKNTQMNDCEREAKIDDASQELRAVLIDLYDHDASNRRYWAEGSAIIRALTTCGAVVIPAFLVMGLLPYFYPPGTTASANIWHWGLLGLSGSTTSMILALYKSNIVEVGHTQGKHELWRAVRGAILGFVSGLLAYSVLKTGIISLVGIDQYKMAQIAYAVLAGFSAGFLFEIFFERLRKTIGQFS